MHVSGHTTRGQRKRWFTFTIVDSGFLRWTALVLIVLASLAVLPARDASAASDAYVSTDVLNLRDDAGTWANVITEMYFGEYVAVIDGPTGDGWYYIDYAGSQGWAYGAYLSIDGVAGWAGEPADSYTGVGAYALTAWVNTDLLNVRAEANAEAWVLDLIEQGAQITVIGDPINGFAPIDYYGQTGFVWNDFLSYDGPVDPGPERWIDVNRTAQVVTLFVGDEAIASYWGAMGWDESDDGFYATAVGTYYVYGKYADLAWTDWGSSYIMWWVGFDPSRVNGFHSYSMDSAGNVLKRGDGPTGGCVALEPGAAQALFGFASYGMRVEVHR